jgi:hypothetical protein
MPQLFQKIIDFSFAGWLSSQEWGEGGKMKRLLLFACIGGLLATSTCPVASAQATAQISGAVRDQSGAVLPGVEITAVQTDTGISRSTVSNETGSYVLPNLAIGPYRLQAELPGFRSYAQSGIMLQVNSNPVINIDMEVGQVSEQVDVQANAAMVETRSSTVGSVIENERVLELPLNGRNVTDLIALAGAAVQVNNSNDRWMVTPSMSVAGGSSYSVDFTLDGASHVNFISGGNMAMPFPDAMQEFKVENSGVSAQRGSPTSVAAVTKSGTNEFHGNLFEFVRNDLFNARSYFATSKSTLKRNQFGGTVGGPIVKNRLFFFAGYQGTTVRQDPADTRAFIPTPAMLAGDWTAFASPACNAGRQLNLAAPFTNNRIDPALFSKPALFVVNWRGNLPFPTTTDPCGQVTYGNLTGETSGNYVGKVDYQQSDKHSLFGRVLIQKVDLPDPFTFNQNLLPSTGYNNQMHGSYTLGSTYLLGANTVQAFRLAVNRSAVHYYNTKPGQLFNWCDAGVKIYCDPILTRIQSLSINSGFSLGGGFLTGQVYISNTYSLNDDVSLIRGAHQWAFGVNVSHGRDNSASNQTVANFTFSGVATGNGLADFMLGNVGSVIFARPAPHEVKATTAAVYAADSWKVKPKLTLNYGLRWEPYIAPYVGAIFNFDHDRFMQGIKSTVYVNAPAGMYYPGDPGFPGHTGMNNHWMHFAPRMGLAWDVSGDGRTSVRASYALAYVYVPGDFRETYSGQPPFGNRTTLTSPSGGLEDPWRGIPGGNIFPYQVNKFAPFPSAGQVYTVRADTKSPYSQSWSFTIQRQLGQEWLVSTTYTGSNLTHVWTNRALNPSTFFPGGPCTLNGVTYNTCSTVGNTEARRRFTLENPAVGPSYGYVAELDDGAKQNYNGMLLSVERRAGRGVTVTGNYTFSHCIGDYATLYGSMGMWVQDTYADPHNRRLDRGNCDSDRRHVFNLTSVAQTPQFANPKLRLLGSGWRLAGIYTRSAGSPLTILAGSDRALNGLQASAGLAPLQRASQASGEPFGNGSRPLANYLAPAAFAQPVTGTLGNLGRNSIQGPGTWTFDMALSRIFSVREEQRLEFRAEAFNLTNSFRPGNPNVTLNNATFGVIRTSLAPRVLQFALKYVF